MSDEVKTLKSELALVKLQFNERVSAVESRLNDLLEIKSHHQHKQDYSVINVDENASVPMQSETTEKEALLPKTADEYLAINRSVEVTKSVKPSFITIFFQAVLSSLFDWFSPITKIYQSYKERGMLGIFILTIVGIGLTLAGFGYLMQFLIDQLGAGAKALLMCIQSKL